MASTISINFATVDEVFANIPDLTDPEGLRTISTAPQKKSVSARVLAEALGGGRVGGGYVQRTGGMVSQMTGFLYLTGKMPIEPLHAVPKKYVDDHSYTRRYHFVCRQSPDPSNPSPGFLSVGSTVVSGFDLNTNPFYFFDRTDISREAVSQYVDVYRDGILQKYGLEDDYEILNTRTFFGGTTAIRFKEPFVEGTTVQVNIGNVGALPLTFGVQTMSAGYGLMTTYFSGDVSMFVTPSSFAASSLDVSLSTVSDKYVSPKTLSAYPLMPRALGLFRKVGNWVPGDPPLDYYGSDTGEYSRVKSFKINRLINRPDGSVNDTRLHRAIIEEGALTDTNYNPVVTMFSDEFSEDPFFIFVISGTRTLTSFDFYVTDIFEGAPPNIDELSILIY